MPAMSEFVQYFHNVIEMDPSVSLHMVVALYLTQSVTIVSPEESC